MLINAFVTPIKGDDGKTFEYQSVRTKLDDDVKKRATTLYAKLNKKDTPKRISFHTDMTLWVQVVLMMLVIASLLSFVTSDASLWIAIPNLILALVGFLIFSNWRNKYKKIIKLSKDVFDNKLMSYLYSGNNDDVGTIELALKMQKSQLSAVVGRVSDDSDNITNLAQQSSDMGNDIAKTLSEQAAETEQVATAMNQMSTTIQGIAKIVTFASKSSQQGLDVSNQGQAVVQKTVESITDLSAQLTTVDSAISRLVNGTKSIDTVLNPTFRTHF